VVAVGLAAVTAGLLSVAQRFTPSPAFVERITVVNPTVYHLEIDARGLGGKVSVTLGSIGRQQTKTYEGILDQGREWIFHFASGAADGGEISVARVQLVHDHWRLTIPDAVGRRLQAAGVLPSPAE
jgi:hypothetical protein